MYERPYGFFKNIKSVHFQEAKKIESQYVRNEEGGLLRD